MSRRKSRVKSTVKKSSGRPYRVRSNSQSELEGAGMLGDSKAST